jgi:SAM-dependent methyltransferase
VIETTVPEINVIELMERVRAEADRLKAAPRRALVPAETSPQLPPVTMLPGAPAVWIPAPVKSRKQRVDALVETARSKNEPHSKIPKFLRRFFRKQGGYNRAVVESIASLSKTTDDVARRLGEITTCLGQFNGWLLALHEQSDADARWMKAAAPGVALVGTLNAHLNDLESARADELESARTALAARIDAGETRLESVRMTVDQLRDDLAQRIQGLHAELDGLTRRLSDFQPGLESLARHSQVADEMQHQVDNAGLHLRNLQVQTDRIGVHVDDLQGQADRLGIHVNNLQGFVDQRSHEAATFGQSLDERVSRVATDNVFLKGELSEYGSLLRQLLTKERTTGTPAKTPPETAPMALDSFYLNFENRFRGSRAEIKSRVAFYLPFIRKARAGSARRPILDLGCGRGEWLELLKEEKLEGRGIDLNTTMIAHCKAHRLKVRLADAVEHLRSLRANSHGAITGFHIIEHVPFVTLMDLFGEARRVLQPGGVAIFESPNCKNLMVGACNFNIDPTHHNPVFPETAEFMLAWHGFEKIRIEYLSPVSDIEFDGATPELATIKELLFGPQDFGIIAYKPKAR